MNQNIKQELIINIFFFFQSGFGKYSDLSPNVSENLKFNFIPVIPNSVCEAVYGSWLIHDTNICAETTPEASTCNGDSGKFFI